MAARPDLAACLSAGPRTQLSGCGPGYTPEEIAEATAQFREAFRLEDYEYGAELGEEWSARAPDALEFNAWTVAHLARVYSGRSGSLSEGPRRRWPPPTRTRLGALFHRCGADLGPIPVKSRMKR